MRHKVFCLFTKTNTFETKDFSGNSFLLFFYSNFKIFPNLSTKQIPILLAKTSGYLNGNLIYKT